MRRTFHILLEPAVIQDNDYLMEHEAAYTNFTDEEMDSLTNVEHIRAQVELYDDLLETDLGQNLYDLIKRNKCNAEQRPKQPLMALKKVVYFFHPLSEKFFFPRTAKTMPYISFFLSFGFLARSFCHFAHYIWRISITFFCIREGSIFYSGDVLAHGVFNLIAEFGKVAQKFRFETLIQSQHIV